MNPDNATDRILPSPARSDGTGTCRRPASLRRRFRRGAAASGLAALLAALASFAPATRAQQPAGAGAAAVSTQAARPIIKADELVHDFGTTWIGAPLQHTFTITNAGNAPLKILKVEPGCGCTVAGKYPPIIEPGASGKFPFSLNTSGLYYQYDKPITIVSNDPVTPNLRLSLRGLCKRYVEVVPVSAYFGVVTNETPTEQVLKIKNNAPTPLTLTLEPQPPNSKFRFTLTETKAGQEFELRVTLVRRDEPGDCQGVAFLRTNIEAQKTVDVRAFARIPRRVDVLPETIMIVKRPDNTPPPSSPMMQFIRVNNYGTKPVKVLDATTDEPALRLRLTEQMPGKTYTVQVQFDADYLPPPEGRTIIIKTDDPEIPQIRVPVRRWPPPPAPPATAPATRPATRAARPAERMTGKPAPRFMLKTAGGKTLSNADFSTHAATVLDFVAPNCPHCRKQVPMIERVRADYESKNIRFVNVSETMGTPVGDEAAAEVFRAIGSRIDFAADPGNRVGYAFSATSLPTLFVIRPDGVIARVLIGDKPQVETSLRTELSAMLRAKPAVPGPGAAAKPAG
ncbi:MAG: DUF1573 domain-containing protein [Phycisphaerae bacterium]